MRRCEKCGAEYTGDFCPTGCDSPAFQQRLEAQRVAAKRAKEPTVQRRVLVFIVVICILRVVVPMLSLGVLYPKMYGNSQGRHENTVAFGAPGVYSNCEIIITDMTRSEGLSYDHPSEGMEYIIVTVHIRNIERVPGDLPDDVKQLLSALPYDKNDFRLRTETGGMIQPGFSFAHKETALTNGYLDPWEQVSGTVLFEAPIGCEPELYYYYHGIDFLEGYDLSLQFELE